MALAAILALHAAISHDHLLVHDIDNIIDNINISYQNIDMYRYGKKEYQFLF